MKKKILPLLILVLCLMCASAGAQEIGIASYYSKNITRKTASGERHHKDSMVCAHKTHPFGTLLKVTHMKNRKFVIVKVNDRGPFGPGRIVDLSWGAAKKLGMLSAGLAKVTVEVFNGRLDSEIDTHPSDSTDLLIDYENRNYDFPYIPKEDSTKQSVPQKEAKVCLKP